MFRLAFVLLFLALPAAANVAPIYIIDQATTTISVATTSAATALPRGDAERKQIELQNAGTTTIFVRFCPSSTCTATVAASYPVLQGMSKVVTVPPDTTHIATIHGGSSTHTLYVTLGTGN